MVVGCALAVVVLEAGDVAHLDAIAAAPEGGRGVAFWLASQCGC
jgi:hypothetical protein